MTVASEPWLQAGEPPVFRVVNEASVSPFLLTADHAGQQIPKILGDLGLAQAERERHIAWDIGIAGVTEKLAAALPATAILQSYSRLVIDCNRRPSVPSAFPEISEATRIPGNARLSAADKAGRRAAIFDPYHAEIARLLAARAARKTIYIAMHSFTPVYQGVRRPMHVAVLYNRSPRAAKLLAAALRRDALLVVAENEPYSVSDETDYGVPVHAEGRGLDYVEIEIRQDLIAEEAGQTEWAARLAGHLPMIAKALDQ